MNHIVSGRCCPPGDALPLRFKGIGMSAQHSDDELDQNVALADFKPGEPYACSVAPFVAYADDSGVSSGVKSARGDEESGEPTVTVRIPGRGRITLPLWFATEYVAAAPATRATRSRRPKPSNVPSAFVPDDDVDEHQPVFVTTERVVPGWKPAGGCVTAPAVGPPPLIGTGAERRVAAAADAGIALVDTKAVPHAVVPQLVTQHVLGPYVMRLKCTVVQACRGVASCEAGLELDLASVPNVTQLTFTTVPASRAARFNFDSVRNLTALDFRVGFDEAILRKLPPILTLRKLALSPLWTASITSITRCLETVSAFTPNVEDLSFTQAIGDKMTDPFSVDTAWVFAAREATMWPRATALSFEASIPVTAVMANARPWRRLSVQWRKSQALFGKAVPIPEDLHQRIVSETRLSGPTPSLEEFTLHNEGDSDLFFDLVWFFPDSFVDNITAFALPNLCVTAKLPKPFFMRCGSLTSVRVRDIDFGNGVLKFGRPAPEDVGPEAEAAVLNSKFPLTVRSVVTEAPPRRWARGVDGQWVRSSIAPDRKKGRVRAPQVFLVGAAAE